jgi:hypothetical protein
MTRSADNKDQEEATTQKGVARHSDPVSSATPTPRSALPTTPDLPADEPEPETETRTRQASGRRSGEDTLLSMPAPVEGEEPVTSAQLDELARRLDQLEARLQVIEVSGGQLGASTRRWLVWIAFMVTLAVTWQIVDRLR